MAAGDWKDMFQAACDGDTDVVRHHLEHGVDPDHVHPEFQSTALVAALLAGRPDVADLLLDHGADPCLVSPLEGLTPVQAADAAGLEGLVARLVGAGAAAPAPASGGGARRRLLRLRRS